MKVSAYSAPKSAINVLNAEFGAESPERDRQGRSVVKLGRQAECFGICRKPSHLGTDAYIDGWKMQS